jgi:hypothetical protein
MSPQTTKKHQKWRAAHARARLVSRAPQQLKAAAVRRWVRAVLAALNAS